jgi:uncharacterized protein YhaN
MKPPLAFRALHVRRMPGFPAGGPELDELSPGINLVHGPNASGKTTTAQALQALLWPRTGPAAARVEGRFQLGVESWRVDVESRRPSWQRNGQDAPAPPLPPADDRDRYLLALHDLLRADDRGLAERIRVESAGGYDVPAAGRDLGFRSGGRPRALVDAVAAARASLREAREREAALRDDVAELARLAQRRRECVRVADRLPALRRALELARATAGLALARGALDAFPAAMARLAGDELERLEEWATMVSACDGALAEAAAAEAAALTALEQVGLGEAGVEAGVLAGMEARLEEIRQADADRARAAEALAEARGRRERAAAAAGLAPDRPAGPDLAVPDAARLDRLLDRAGRLRAERAALEERLRALGGDAGTSSAREPADEAIRLLRRWLRAGSGDPAGERRARTLLLVAVLALGGVGILALALGAYLTTPVAQGVGAALLVLASVLLVLRPGRATDERASLQAAVSRTGRAPDRWTEDAVERTLDALEQEAAEARAAAARRAEAERLACELERLVEEEAGFAAERADVARALGLDPPPDDLPLHLLGARLLDLEEARSAEAAAEALLGEVEARREAAIAAADAAARPYGYALTDAHAASAALKDLRDRRERHQAATTALASARTDGDRAARDRDGALARRTALFDALGLEPDGDVVLRGWLDRLPDYRRARSELELAERVHAEAQAAAAAVGVPTGMDPADVPLAELEAALAETEAAATEERALAERIAGIEARLNAARQKHDVEEALARVATAEADLIDRRDADIEAEVGAILVDWLAEAAADHGRPAVFHRARELFGRITRGRYRLDMEEGDGAGFRAYDTTTHRGHALDELSSGTRLQLLLAVRVAFVETQETGAALPLLLDEVLANCDDERAAAIIDAALAIARDGRQVFYFTAQADEMAKWLVRLKGQDEVDWCVRAILDRGSGEQLVIEWPEPARSEVLPPDGRDHAAYGRALGVPPFDPWADGVGGLHLWYLVDDVDALHQLLLMGVSRWGQLDYLTTVGGEDALPGGMRPILERARHAAVVAERFRQLWRQGRGRPVDRAALAESGAISDTFFDRVAELCEELGGAGEALLEALADGRIPRFRAAQADQLRAFLQQHGYVTDDEPLAPDSIRLRLTAECRDGVDADALVERLVRGP